MEAQASVNSFKGSAPDATIAVTGLLRLLRGRPSSAAGATPLPTEGTRGGGAAAGSRPGHDRKAQGAALSVAGHVRPWSLRRDGMRPLRFHGSPLLKARRRAILDCMLPARDVPGQLAICHGLAIFIDIEGAGVVASASLEFDEDRPFRPVFTAARVAGEQALQDLLDAHLRRCVAALPADVEEAISLSYRDMMRESGVRYRSADRGRPR